MTLEDELYRADPDDYGDQYRAHVLEQYKLYVEIADRLSTRRSTANSFFPTVNTALITFSGLVTQRRQSDDEPVGWVVVVALAGLLLCFSWYRLVRSYKDLNTGKFRVIHAMEAKLPLAPYDAEWDSVGRCRRPELYLPFTAVELRIPAIFAPLYVGLAVYRLLQSLP